MKTLVDLALEEYFFRWPADRYSIRHDPKEWITNGEGLIVGFLTPRLAKSGFWRFGPLFLHPDWRGKGIMAQAIRQHLGNVSRAMAWIEDGNEASRALHTRLGFVEKHKLGYGKVYHWVAVKK